MEIEIEKCNLDQTTENYSFNTDKLEGYIEVEIPNYLLECLGSSGSLESLCRICLLPSENMISITDKEDNHMSLLDMLKLFTSIPIFPESGMPIQICVNCHTELLYSYNFKVKCDKAECVLQAILKGQLIPTEESIDQFGINHDNTFNIDERNQYKEDSNFKDHCEVQYIVDDLNDVDSGALCAIQEPSIEDQNLLNVIFTDPNTLLKEVWTEKKSIIDENVQENPLTLANDGFEDINELESLKSFKVPTIENDYLEEISYPCGDCKEVFLTQHDLQIHLAVHVAGPAWKCKQCFKVYRTRAMLRRHLHRHMDSKRFKCPYCDKSFTELYALRRHTRVHTGETVEKKHACKVCNKKYSENSLLALHMMKHTQERPFVCAVCGKSFASSRLLASHRLVHTEDKPYACNYCEKRFRHDSTRNTHHRTHTGEKPYVCSVCGKTFIQNSNLRLHMRTHTGEKPYPCKYCDKKFTSGSALKIHTRTHTGEKPYSCKICNKQFARLDLGAHTRSHTGERPHACRACPKRFVSAARLREHARTHTGEKPFECATCTQTFPTKSHLVKHLKQHKSNKKPAKRRYTVVSHVAPLQFVVADEKQIAPTEEQQIAPAEEQDQDKDAPQTNEESQKDHLEVEHEMPTMEVTQELVLHNEGEVLVVDNTQNQSGIYLSTEDVNQTDEFGNNANFVGSTVKLYQVDQSLVQIHTSGSQVTISKITSKVTANF